MMMDGTNNKMGLSVGKEEDLHDSSEIDSISFFSITTNPSEYFVINIIFNEP